LCRATVSGRMTRVTVGQGEEVRREGIGLTMEKIGLAGGYGGLLGGRPAMQGWRKTCHRLIKGLPTRLQGVHAAIGGPQRSRLFRLGPECWRTPELDVLEFATNAAGGAEQIGAGMGVLSGMERTRPDIFLHHHDGLHERLCRGDCKSLRYGIVGDHTAFLPSTSAPVANCEGEQV
jgi:hypothetical protein